MCVLVSATQGNAMHRRPAGVIPLSSAMPGNRAPIGCSEVGSSWEVSSIDGSGDKHSARLLEVPVAVCRRSE